MNKTSIEYLDFTWNPVTGCTPVSDGCAHCWARAMHGRKMWGDRPFSEVTLHPERLEEPLRRKKPARIGVCLMGDLFHDKVPDGFIDRVFDVMLQCDHRFFVLTKRPERMESYFTGFLYPALLPNVLKNLWLGVSVENQATADERIPLLLRTPAAVRFVSLEPMLEYVNLTCVSDLYFDALYGFNEGKEKIDWVICGGESGPKARPMKEEWARSVRDQCKVAGVPFFMKQMSGRTTIPDDLKVREFPHDR